MRDKAIVRGRAGRCLLASALVVLALLPIIAYSQQYNGVDAYEEYGKRLGAAQAVAPLTDSVFGDQVSLYNGATTFKVTDVSLPGNGALPVAVGRELVIEDHRMVPVDGGPLRGFADWSLDVPYVWGTFTAQNGWTLYPDAATDRCSDTTSAPDTQLPVGAGAFQGADVSQIWNGDLLHIPGTGGDQRLYANTEAKSPVYAGAATYPWVTRSHWRVSCIPTVSNLAGEGFVAVSPSGVSYTFNYAVTVPTSPFEWLPQPPKATVKLGPFQEPRVNVYLLATRVADRFGNWVSYSYSGNHLTGITSSDGRSIALSWSGATITAVSSAAGTWHYSYGTNTWTDGVGTTFTSPYLSAVTRPDGSEWTYTINSGSLITTKEDWALDDPLPHTHCQFAPTPNSGSFSYSIGAPSGAQATYVFGYGRHIRSYVPEGCVNETDPNLDYSMNVTDYFDNFSIVSKQVNGPGLAPTTWTYDYGEPIGGGYFRASLPVTQLPASEIFSPPGTCSACIPTKVVTVTGPDSKTLYTYGIEYARDEGQLLSTQVTDLSGNVLRTTTNTYITDAQAASAPFPNIVGPDSMGFVLEPMANRNRPVTSTTITQDGATFTATTNSFDAFARGTSETESSSLGYSKTSTTTYADDLNLWVLGMVTQSATNGITTAQTNYDSLDRPTSEWKFGKLVGTKAWNADGTLASVTDGDGHTTTLSNWYRGLPQQVAFADGTRKSATVNDAGWITSLTDENGFTTNYAYDPMGRLSQISYPTGDGVAWNPTLLSFTQASGAEYGIPAGHWTQTVHTGNGYAVTYFDALWRPLLTRHYDAGNQAATESDAVALYDEAGRKVFTSYPARGVTDYLQTLPGTSTAYDALNRVTQVQQDTELGTSTTTTQYLTGFQTEVTDPRGNSTTTSYYAYGSPDGALAYQVAAPAGETTTITRDAFGKPVTIARNGVTYDTLVYDANQQLCKRVANGVVSFYAWDGAGNLAWSANGANGYADASCADVSPANAAGHVVTRTYDPRNRLATLAFPDGNGNQTWTYTPDGLPSEITTANNGVGTVANDYLYDQRRLPISEAMTLAGQPTRTLGFGYDANAHLSTQVEPSGQTYLYTPDALGEATQLAINGGSSVATGITYLPDGHIGGYTLGNGITHVLTENTRDLPSEIHDGTAEDLIYTYDADANPTLVSDNANGTRTATLHYDALDRLSYAAIAGIDSNTPTNYSYNALDQLTEMQQGTHIRTYAYDAHYTDELTEITDNQLGTTAYTWDAQGNLASRAGQAFQFDVGNRLRGVIGSETGYAYDANGRRVSQTSTGGTIESFYDKAGQLAWQRDRDGNTHDDLYLGGKLVAIRDFNSTGTQTGIRYQHTDALGSVIAQTGSSGAVIAGTQAIYDAWGGVHGISMQDGPGYTGHVEDAATGLVYMQQRYYDPNVGRFLSMDPVQADGKVGGNLDRYWYANDNPYRYTDPDGRCTGSHITNSHGNCASTGGDTTDSNGAIQGLNKALAAAAAEARAAAIAAAASHAPSVTAIGTTAVATTATWEETGSEFLGDALRAAGGLLGDLGAALTAPVTVGIGLTMMPTPMGAAPCEISSTPCGMPSKARDVPNVGPPGQWVNGRRRSRLYGPTGRPRVDIDNPHQGADYPHVHEWDENGEREHPGREVPDLPPPPPSSEPESGS